MYEVQNEIENYKWHNEGLESALTDTTALIAKLLDFKFVSTIYSLWLDTDCESDGRLLCTCAWGMYVENKTASNLQKKISC